MPEHEFEPRDVALFRDLARAALERGLEPCLIGAGALVLGRDQRWSARLTRATLDWDFAVRVASWEEFDELVGALTGPGGGFSRAPEPHRLLHEQGGRLDLVPYGGNERPPGTIEWPRGVRMQTLGLETLDAARATVALGVQGLRAASLPVLLGLKVLAAGERWRDTQRDLADVEACLASAESALSNEERWQLARERLEREELEFAELDAYVLGRQAAGRFSDEARATLRRVVAEHLERTSSLAEGPTAEARRLRAWCMGVEDGACEPD